MKFILIFSSVLLANFSTQAQSNYKGVGFQKEINESWSISLKKDDSTSFKVTYPSIPCTANWNLIKETESYKVYKEKLTTGLDKCIDDGYIFIVDDTFSKSTKRFYIFETAGDENPSAYGFLEVVFK